MTTPTELREKVARAIFEELDVLGISVTPELAPALGAILRAVESAANAAQVRAMQARGARREERDAEFRRASRFAVEIAAIIAASPLAEPGA